jgi:hypothetical protein
MERNPFHPDIVTGVWPQAGGFSARRSGDGRAAVFYHVAGWVGCSVPVAGWATCAPAAATGHRRMSAERSASLHLHQHRHRGIWARPIWNTWWTWDPRLTTATIMELLYAAYLMLRSGIEDPDRRARFGAVYAIVGFVSVP